MRVVIRSISSDDRTTRVMFSSAYGEGVADWAFGSPSIDTEYFAELECKEVLKLGINAFISETSAPALVHEEGETTFTGQIETIFENRTMSVRFGDALFLAETEGNLPSEGTWISITSKHFSLYNTNI